MYKTLLRPLLFKSDAERIHDFSRDILSKLGKNKASRKLTESFFNYENSRLNTEVAGIEFSNPIGLAAGFDKHCELLEITKALGFGFSEVGTITAMPQEGHEKPRMFRLEEDKALINRMGFNNHGANTALQQLKNSQKITPIGLNIGKSRRANRKEVMNDYLFTYTKLKDYVDFIVVNVSSPNTEGLRSLQEKTRLKKLLTSLNKEDERTTKFVKISPDLTLDQVDEVIEVVEKCADGIVAVNTTRKRKNLNSKTKEKGGLSGRPLTIKARNRVKYLYERCDTPIIGVGGVFNAQDAYELIKNGANLVEAYTGFIYEGPSFAKKINKGLVKRMNEEGYEKISEIVGEKI